MIGTEDGYWFSVDSSKSPVTYSFHHGDVEIETGEALSVDEMWDRFDAMVVKRRAETVS